MALSLSRRAFLGTSSAGLTLGLTAGGVISLAANAAAPSAGTSINNWLTIGADGAVTLYSNAQEMGQGGFSGVAQVLAEELCLRWQDVQVRTAPIIDAMGMANGAAHWTGGSASIRSQWDKLRLAGAAAREMLLTAGAARLGVPVGECRAVDGAIQQGGRRIAYGDLVADAAKLPVPAKPALLPRGDWKLIGQPLLRKDIAAKVDGSAIFATDVKLPGLLSASLMQCPVFGGRLVSVDPAPALLVPGVRHVVAIQGVEFPMQGRKDPVRMADGVAVLASNWWAAQQGLKALSPMWDARGNDGLDEAGLNARLMDAIAKPGAVMIWAKDDSAAKAQAAHSAGMARASDRFSADYRVPILAHAQMEPLSAVAHVRADRAEIWSGCQFPTGVRRVLAGLTGLPEPATSAHVLLSGGGFGRRYILDYIAIAAYLSKSVAAPVKLIYAREEDLAQGRYRPATAARLIAGLDGDGMPMAIETNTVPMAGNVWIGMTKPGQADQPDHQPSYFLPAGLSRMTSLGLPVPEGPWRAPGSTQCAFFFESFVDELAHRAGQDPLAYRRRLLASNPRALRVLDAAAAAAGWGRLLPAGEGLGIAIWNSFQSIAAQVVHVAVTGADRRLVVKKVWCAFDCGTVVNPDSVRAQGEGSVLMALSATLAEKVTLDKGAVTSRNFDSYSLARLHQMPEIEIILLDSPDAPVGGAGEPMTPPLPPALTNAIFAATGQRVRSLPLSDHGFDVGV